MTDNKSDQNSETRKIKLRIRLNSKAFKKACYRLFEFSEFVEFSLNDSKFQMRSRGETSNHSVNLDTISVNLDTISVTVNKNNFSEIYKLADIINEYKKCDTVDSIDILIFENNSISFKQIFSTHNF